MENTSLVPLKGEVCTQYIRCGKPQCRCRTGQLHGPYYYRVWRDGGRVRKVYVKPSELAEVRAACALYHALNATLREQRVQREQFSQQMTRAWRRTERLLQRSRRARSRPHLI